MTTQTLEQALIGIAALGATLAVSLTIYLGCLRFVAWDLVPASALPHVQWWRRHARPVRLITLGTSAIALLTWLIIRL